MMKKSIRMITALLLAAMLCLSFLPVAAFAGAQQPAAEPASSQQPAAGPDAGSQTAPVYYKITFLDGSGSPMGEALSVEAGQCLQEGQIPLADGAGGFQGWRYTKNGAGEQQSTSAQLQALAIDQDYQFQAVFAPPASGGSQPEGGPAVTVTFMDGGSTVAVLPAEGGAVAPPNVDKQGFAGWQDAQGRRVANFSGLTASITVYAVYEGDAQPAGLTATFVVNGVSTPGQVDENGRVTRPTQLEPAGFLYWAGEDGKEFDFSQPITRPVVLTAVLQGSGLAATFKVDGAVLAVVPADADGKVAPPQAPAKEGHTLLCWSEDGQTPFDFSQPITQSVVVHAVFRSDGAVRVRYVYQGTPAFSETREITKGSQTPYIPLDPKDYGMAVFHGWYTQPDPDEKTLPFDFSSSVDADMTLYAVFGDACLVRFLDQDGHVVQAERLEPGEIIRAPRQETVDKIALPDGFRLDYWYEKGGDEAVAFAFDVAAAGRDLTLVPHITNEYVVIFISAGSQVPPQWVKYNATVKKPANPSRAGYTFVDWKTEDGQSFDFATPITRDTTLTAAWKGESGVKYSVAIWMEKPGYGVGFVPRIPADYNHVTTVELSGTAGEKTALDIFKLPSEIGKLFEGKDDSVAGQLLRYGVPVSVEEKVIQGNGKTVVNLYAMRKIYTYVFDLGENSKYSMTIGGKTYYGGDATRQYKVEVKYEMDVSSLVPTQGVATFRGFGKQKFRSWQPPDTLKDNQKWLTKRTTVGSGMLSPDGQEVRYVFKPYLSDGTLTLQYYRYFAERLPDQPLDPEKNILRNGVVYALMENMSQDIEISGKLEQKGIEGMTAVDGPDPIGYNYSDSKGWVPNKNGKYQCFFYKRKTYPLTFNMMDPSFGIRTIQNQPKLTQQLLYGESLEGYKPQKTPYFKEGNYKFMGWYSGPDYSQEFDFSRTISAGGANVYARWDAQDYIVTFLDGRGGRQVDERGVKRGEYLLERDSYYKLGSFYQGKGLFKGWYYDAVPGRPAPFSYDTPIHQNYTLYAAWTNQGFSITYSVGEGSGRAPVDPNTYGIDDTPRILSPGDGLVAPAGKKFYAWADENGKLYFPGFLVSIGEFPIVKDTTPNIMNSRLYDTA